MVCLKFYAPPAPAKRTRVMSDPPNGGGWWRKESSTSAAAVWSMGMASGASAIMGSDSSTGLVDVWGVFGRRGSRGGIEEETAADASEEDGERERDSSVWVEDNK